MPDGTVPYVLNCGAPAASLSTPVLETEIAPQLANLARSLQKSLGPQADPPFGSRGGSMTSGVRGLVGRVSGVI